MDNAPLIYSDRPAIAWAMRRAKYSSNSNQPQARQILINCTSMQTMTAIFVTRSRKHSPRTQPQPSGSTVSWAKESTTRLAIFDLDVFAQRGFPRANAGVRFSGCHIIVPKAVLK